MRTVAPPGRLRVFGGLRLSLRTCFLVGFIAVAGCAQNASSVDEPGTSSEPVPPTALGLGPVGTEDALDVMTWNLEQFPVQGTSTVAAAAEAILLIKPDVVAVQEVTDGNALFDLADAMPGWEADVAAFFDPNGPYNPPVGMLYDTATIEVNNRFLLFEDDYLAFPRSPLVLEVTWRGVPLVIINVHLKALGDDRIDWSDPWDEEVRRARACERLEQYIYEELPDRRVIVLGDFNDRLQEPPATNVFSEFFAWPGYYLFADMPTAVQTSGGMYSYPKSGSHIDHVLITDELFMAYFREASFARALPVERTLENGWYQYEATLSDHRPVLLHLDMGMGQQQ